MRSPYHEGAYVRAGGYGERMPCSLVVFDMDHTLVASDHLPRVWIEVLIAYGATLSAAHDAYEAGMGCAAVVTAQAAFPARHKEWDAIVAEFTRRCRREASYEPLPYAEQTLVMLARRKIAVAVSTGAREEHAKQVLARWDGLIGSVHGYREGYDKPAHLAALAQRVPVEEMASVGDGMGEMRAASEAGLAWRIGLMAHNGLGSRQAHMLREAGAQVVLNDLSGLATALGLD